MRPLRLGTRGSELALAQAGWVADRLRGLGREVEVVPIETTGDRTPGPLSEAGGKAAWVDGIEDALAGGAIDLAVHSAKDLPAELGKGLEIGAYPPREDPRDAFVGAPGRRFDSLPPGSRVGTGSLRRIALLRALRPELEPVPLRGNVTTRLAKIERLGLHGLLLASAGLIRLGLEDRISDPLDPERYLPAGGQGALAVEVRSGDAEVRREVERLDDPAAAARVRSERAFLCELGGDCRAAVAVHAAIRGPRLRLRAAVFSTDGGERLEGSAESGLGSPEGLGAGLGRELLGRGARRLLDAAGG